MWSPWQGCFSNYAKKLFPLGNIMAEAPLGALGLGPIFSGFSLRMSSSLLNLFTSSKWCDFYGHFQIAVCLKIWNIRDSGSQGSLLVPRQLVISLGGFEPTQPRPENHSETSPLSLKMCSLFSFMFKSLFFRSTASKLRVSTLVLNAVFQDSIC